MAWTRKILRRSEYGQVTDINLKNILLKEMKFCLNNPDDQ